VCAGATSRIRFGTDVLVLPYRNPVYLSQLVAGIDHHSGGRLTLGTGVGYIRGEFSALGVTDYDERGAITDEHLEILRLLWETTGPVSYGGRWTTFDNVFAEPKPLQSPFPLWVGGNVKTARRRAAKYGSGWHPLFPTPEQYAVGRTEIEATRPKERPFTYSYSCPFTQVLDEPAGAMKIESYTDMPDVPDEYRYAPPFPVDDAGRFRFVGSPDEVAGDLGVYDSAGAEHAALRFWTHQEGFGVTEFVAQLERFMHDVVPLTGHNT
jgi:alkanesulfonate monooxygenase SsuD/methylene tetrahydromethanopterin reductase-like flavin-dependent oxidoreductase (luciferase family)